MDARHPALPGLSVSTCICDGRDQRPHNTSSDLFPEKAQDGYDGKVARIDAARTGAALGNQFWGQNVFNTEIYAGGIQLAVQGGSSLSFRCNGGWRRPATQLFSAYLAFEPRTLRHHGARQVLKHRAKNCERRKGRRENRAAFSLRLSASPKRRRANPYMRRQHDCGWLQSPDIPIERPS